MGRIFFETLYKTFFTIDAPLYSEVFNLLRGELKEPKNYMAVLQAILLGRKRFGEISNVSGIPTASLMKYLSVLRDLRLLKHGFPVGSKRFVKGGLRKINDQLLNFWFDTSQDRILINSGKNFQIYLSNAQGIHD